MSKLFFFSLFLPLLALAGAGDGIDEAAKFCNTDINSSSEKDKCIKLVSESEFFETKALNICRNETHFPNQQYDCLASVANKTYRDFEIKACQDKSFSKKIIKCLKDQGKKFVAEANPETLDPKYALCLGTVKDAKKLMLDGENRQALKLIDAYLDSLKK